MLLMSSTIQVK